MHHIGLLLILSTGAATKVTTVLMVSMYSAVLNNNYKTLINSVPLQMPWRMTMFSPPSQTEQTVWCRLFPSLCRAGKLHVVQDSVWFDDTDHGGDLPDHGLSEAVKNTVWIGRPQEKHRPSGFEHSRQSGRAPPRITNVPSVFVAINPRGRFSRIPDLAPEKVFVRL